MIPILFEANETAFTSQGLGALADAVSCSVARVVNGKDELTMVYPSEGLRYADLANDRIIYAQPEYRKSAQPYQIYKITKPLNGKVTVYARHVGSQRSAYIPVVPFSAGSLTETFTLLPNYLAEPNPFTFWTNKTVTANIKLNHPASLGKVLGGMEGSILDVYGGEYEYDGYTIKLWQRRGVNSGVELRYGKNITDIEQSEDFSSIITGVVPYWEGMDGTIVTLPEVVVEGANSALYSFRRTIVKDFSDRFDEQPSEADLRAVATSFVSQTGIGMPEINLKVSFEHLAQYTGYENLQLLETLNLGDTVAIVYEPLGITATARIAKTTYDVLRDKYTSVQVGSVKTDLEQVMSQVSNTAAQIKENLMQNIPSLVEQAAEGIADLITGVNGGYVVLNRDANGEPYEILIMDTPDKETAINVIRMNNAGIAFSMSGYNGPFTTAWDIRGNFVADYITAGTLTANVMRVGVIRDTTGNNWWNLDTGELHISASNIKTGGRNLLRNSGVAVENTDSPLAIYTLGTSPPQDEEEVTLQISGSAGNGADGFEVYNSGNTVLLCTMTADDYNATTGIYTKTFEWESTNAYNTSLHVYSVPEDNTRTARILWIKLERGNMPTDWTPAPEDQLELTEAAQNAAENAEFAANNALETTQKVEAVMQFTSEGLKISGTEASRDNSYVKIGADKQTFVVDNTEVMVLGADGLETQGDITSAGTVKGGALATQHWTITENANSVWSLNYNP